MPPLPRITSATLDVTLTGVERIRRARTGGRLRLTALDDRVEVLRDRWGVPHIYARSRTDLLFAQGFVHAQDRLWQMDFQRRVVAGRLAEILGGMVLGTDRAIRILGVYRIAQNEVELLDPVARAELNAFAAGVNACMARQPLPVEFALLRYRPEPWQGADSLCWAKMLSWGLSANWETELLRARLIEVLGAERAAELEPLLPSPVVTPGSARFQPPPIVMSEASAGPDGHRMVETPPLPDGIEELPSTGGTVGSNNWVLAGSRTVSGKPLLANDMHLPMSAPAIWYENHLVCTDPADPLDVTGVSFAGIPYVVAGHNGKVAWGFTNGFADVQDIFVEHMRRTDTGIEYEHAGSWHPAEVRQEEIRVKGAPSVRQQVVVTCHGPVINELAAGLATLPGPDGLPERPLTLCWTSLTSAPMFEALRHMNAASTCDEFRTALRKWIAPVQNVVYADTEGNIGYTYAGHVPLRPRSDGMTPVPGWTGEYDWTGFIPFEELPQQSNPPSGFIVSANNRPVDESYPYFIAKEFAQGDRAARIIELIEAKPKHGPADMRLMHLDQAATSLKRLAAHVGAMRVDDLQLQGLIEHVRGWNGEVSSDSAAVAVLQVFGRLVQKIVMEAHLDVAADEAPSLSERALGKGPTPGIQETTFFYHRLWEWLAVALERPDWDWWDLGGGERRDDVLVLALQRTYNYLQQRFGEPVLPGYRNWTWGRLHKITFGHVAGRVPALARHFNRGPYPLGGDFNTVFATGGGVTDEVSTGVIGPPFRFIADLSDLSRCYGLLAPGNSGRPDSRHYDDQLISWFSGKYHPMLYARQDVERGAVARMVLAP